MPGIFENRDCMEAMAEMPDKAFELAIVDPPYGIGNFIPQNLSKVGRRISEKVTWNDTIPNEAYFSELERVSSRLIIWGANYYNSFSTGGAIIWDKGEANPLFSRCEIASISFQKKVDYVQVQWQSGFYRKSKESIVHPCQKPISLYAWLLRKYAKPGWRILDTHVGSGSSLIACEELGFQYAGYEINKEYFEKASARLKSAQMGLFSGAV